MTISINNETPLCVLRPCTTPSRSPSQLRKQWERESKPLRSNPYGDRSEGYVFYSNRHDAAVVVSSCRTDTDSFIPNCPVENILIGSLPTVDKERSDLYFEEDSTDDGFVVDDDSTVSTFSSNSNDTSQGKFVQFADPLVSQVRTRPFTKEEDISLLFYSYEETQRFRQEYRLERKLQSQAAENPETICTISSKKSNDDVLDASMSLNNQKSRHRISRVVVMHNDQLETFYDDAASSNPSPLPITYQYDPCGGISGKSSSDDFFDNDSFWSGSITWY